MQPTESREAAKPAVSSSVGVPTPTSLSVGASTPTGRQATKSARRARGADMPEANVTETLGSFLKQQRELRGMSVPELSRVTRIPTASLDAVESDRFDELPGEVFVRGFLKAYAQAVGLLPAEVLARYTSSRRVVFVTPLPMQTPLQAAREGQGKRFGVAIAFVVFLILLSLALSIVLRPRGHDMPPELSQQSASSGVGLVRV
jgi:cytoskeletal protein RodZ